MHTKRLIGILLQSNAGSLFPGAGKHQIHFQLFVLGKLMAILDFMESQRFMLPNLASALFIIFISDHEREKETELHS